ncbi:MAG: sigma-70 family RNA polymerase sigma factor [Bacteroidales bacterium]
MNEFSDEYYIERILNGDKSSFALLVERYKEMVFTIAFRMMKNREQAEEIGQDAFLKIYRSLKQFRRQSKFSTWLYKIVYNECISELRKKKLPVNSIDDETSQTKDIEDTINKAEGLENDDRKYYIEKALSYLNEDDRMIITLFYHESMSTEEIAQIMDLSVSNVKVKLYRSRNKLHEALHLLLKNEISTLL